MSQSVKPIEGALGWILQQKKMLSIYCKPKFFTGITQNPGRYFFNMYEKFCMCSINGLLIQNPMTKFVLIVLPKLRYNFFGQSVQLAKSFRICLKKQLIGSPWSVL